jgi:hypothetical protein
MNIKIPYYRTFGIYWLLKIFIIILYILGAFGVWTSSSIYLKYSLGLLHTIIALLLIYLFNPFRKVVCSNIHKSVAFSAGIIILLETSLMRYFYSIPITKNINGTIVNSKNKFLSGIKEYI